MAAGTGSPEGIGERVFQGRFVPSFLGTGVILLWLQCVSYARYVWVDAGLTTVMIDLSRCVYIVLLVVLLALGAFTVRFQRVLGWASVGVMTLGSFLFFLQTIYPGLQLTLPAAICSGVGIAWVGGMWMRLYVRMDARDALLYGFASLALSAVLGIVMGFVSDTIALLASMLCPIVAFAMFLRSARVLDASEPSVGPRPDVPRAVDDVYAAEPRSTLVRLCLGVALSSFVIGMSRGFPFGTSIEIGTALQTVQFAVLIALAALTVWLVLGKGVRLRLSTFWWAQLIALAVGVLLLATFDPVATAAGATIIAIVNLYRVSFMWVAVADFGRHRAGGAFYALAAVWFLHLSFRSFGRLLIILFAQGESADSTLFVAVLLCLLIGCAAFVLTVDIPRVRPLFAGVEVAPGLPVRTGGTMAGVATGERAASGEVGQPDGRAERLREDYGLTGREADVALLLAEGRTAGYVAERLALSQHTVRGYMRALYAKLGVHSKRELIDLVRGL